MSWRVLIRRVEWNKAVHDSQAGPVTPQWSRHPRFSFSTTRTTFCRRHFSRAFPWMKIFEFPLKFHWSLFLWARLTMSQHWLGAWTAPSHYLNQWWLVYWRIHASLGLNELRTLGHHSTVWLVLVRVFQDINNSMFVPLSIKQLYSSGCRDLTKSRDASVVYSNVFGFGGFFFFFFFFWGGGMFFWKLESG